MEADPPLALVIVAGPQASGKSAIAGALSEELRARGERVALVALDQIAAMALPTLPSWDAAHHIFETTVALWARAGLTLVIAEGSGSAEEVSRLRDEAPDGAVVVTVATTASFETALTRAQSDPTRGISREYEFLSGVYGGWDDELGRIAPDVVLDTDELSIVEGVQRTLDQLASARDDRV